MTSDVIAASRAKMTGRGVGEAAQEAFVHYLQQLEAGTTGVIREDEIVPLDQAQRADEIQIGEDQAREAFAKTLIIKLNGGLGTSMGLSGPKTMLPVRDNATFLDLIVRQVLAARVRHGVRLPLVFMHSFASRQACLEALAGYRDLPVDDIPLDFVQSSEPKLDAGTLMPVEWPDNPALEWCPGGHGDIYPSLMDSGVLDALVDAGFRYASVANADNLGAFPDPRLAGWFAASGAPFAMEVCRRTANDRKGGHLARRISDGHIILRESAQTRADDQQFFADETRHRYFNTNNLWIDLVAVREAMRARKGVLGLPLIRNNKTVDPCDPSSLKVIQIETAMGAAIEVFDDSAVLEVGRDRFVPVKKTNELLLLRSDCYAIEPASSLLSARCDPMPIIDLDPEHYAMIADFDRRIPHPLGLLDATSFTVNGDVTFGDRVTVHGDVTLTSETPTVIADGTRLATE